MEYILTADGSKKIDSYCIENLKIPSAVLMERAAYSVYEELFVKEYMGADKFKNASFTFIAGVGNNGGDALCLARIMFQKKFNVNVYIAGDMNKLSTDNKLQAEILENIGVKIENIDTEEKVTDIKFGNVIVDGIFGISLNRKVKGLYKKVIEKINESKKYVIALDVPSGLNATSGSVCGESVKADITFTFGYIKSGLILCKGKDYSGKIIKTDIGFDKKALDNLILTENTVYMGITKDDLKNKLPKRLETGNKGSYGKLKIIAGSEKMSGAAYLSSFAAMKSGIGMAYVYTHKNNLNILKTLIPEGIIDDYENEFEINESDVVLIGPGLSINEKSKELVEKVLDKKCFAVIDADGINIIAKYNLQKKLHKKTVITPHIKEMERLINSRNKNEKNVEYIRENILKVAIEFAKEYNCVVVLKDSTTVISDRDSTYINLSGNSGMASAGSGDVLAGILGAMLIQTLDVKNAAVLSAFIHGLAGDLKAMELSKESLMASDIIYGLSDVFKIKK